MTRIQKIAILSVSLLPIMANAILSPGLSVLQEYFFDVDAVWIKMVITISSIFVIPVTLITGRLIFYFKKKHLLYVGLFLYIFGGFGGAFQNTIVNLLIFRSIMGIGLGVLLPLSTSLVADFFNGDDRSRMMGYSSAIKNLGGVIATVLAGFLSLLGWRYPFLVYIVAIFVLVLVVLYLPDKEIPSKTNHKVIITRNVWLLGLSIFAVMQMFFAIPASLSVYIESGNLGTGFLTGLLISLVTVGSFFFGILYHRIKTFFKGYTVVIGLIFIIVGMLGVGLYYNIVSMAFFLLLIGFGLGVVAPNIYLQTTLQSTVKDITLSLAIVSSFSYLGQFASPLFIEFIQNVFNYNTASSPFMISAVIGVISLVAVLINKKMKLYDEDRAIPEQV